MVNQTSSAPALTPHQIANLLLMNNNNTLGGQEKSQTQLGAPDPRKAGSSEPKGML